MRSKSQPSRCKVCGAQVVTAKRRGEAWYGGLAFGGKGRPRECCSDRCRQRWHRRQLALNFGAKQTASRRSHPQKS